MGDEKISLELLGSRMLTMTAELRDLQLRALRRARTALQRHGVRFGALESRFSAQESRFGAQEERMAAMLALLVRVAERIEGGTRDPR